MRGLYGLRSLKTVTLKQFDIGENRGGRRVGHDAALIHDHDAIEQVAHQVHVVRGRDERLRQAVQQRDQPPPCARVETRVRDAAA